MKNIALIALSLGIASFALAQEQPATSNPPRADAATAAPAKAEAGPSDLPPVNHLVYLAKLPTPAALLREAAAQGTTIQRIDRTDDSLVVIYKYADGHTDTFGYTTLTAASTEEEPAAVQPAPVAPAPAPAAGTPPPPAYTVLSYAPAPVYYAPSYRYYDPIDNFWGPLVLGVGIGWATGGHGGHFYHGHGGWRH